MVFYIRKDSKTGGYVVIRVNGDREQHAHVKTIGGCHQLMRLIDLGLEPKSGWLQTSARRLLSEEEYNALKKAKEPYVNSPRK